MLVSHNLLFGLIWVRLCKNISGASWLVRKQQYSVNSQNNYSATNQMKFNSLNDLF